MPQAMKATSTMKANGLAAQEPNDDTTAVETGSMSFPATTAAGSGCASVVAKALRITSAPTDSSAIQTARGTCVEALLVSSAAATVASKPMNAQPPTASAASNAANVEPPLSDSAPKVLVSTSKPCSRKTSSSARPMPTEAMHSAATPSRSALLSASTPNASMIEQTRTSTAPVMTIAVAVGVMPSSVSAHGA